ncbi:hypothetical protein PYW07_017454 [Mythimna separata]|uniref:C-type lectin domain-containing protein n=1 Tax=Mythimna separata TaxID=271217 RepID=A0AAD8DYE9_MYTSE|nr:hypothetical protein PYW07_017454 [Mythimna separata]
MLQIIHFVSLTYLLIASDVVQCKPDYLFNEDAGGWLKLHVIPATWEEAFLRCHYEGAVLASPVSKELAKAIYTLISPLDSEDRIFLGTHDLYSKGHFTSVEGVPLSDLETGEGSIRPGFPNGDCLTMSVRGSANMYTSSCQDPLPFVCYRKLDNQTLNECGTFDNEYQHQRYTGSCYKVHKKVQTWTRAYGICASEGGHLVILNDAEEARVVMDMFPGQPVGETWDRFHVGLRAWTEDRVWTTINGERFEDVFNKWNDDQPNNLGNNQDRATFVREGALDDVDADFKAMFVCEKSPTSLQYEDVPNQVQENLLDHIPAWNNLNQN